MSEHPQHEEAALDVVADPSGAAEATVVEVVEVDEYDVVEVDDDGAETVVEVVEVVTVAEVRADGSATVLEVAEVDDLTDDEDADEDAEADDADTDAAADAAADERVELLDDGSSSVGGRPEALPFTMSAREHFAAVDALEETGDARVDAATARLAEVPDLPTADHVEVYEDVHKRLQDALAEAEVR